MPDQRSRASDGREPSAGPPQPGAGDCRSLLIVDDDPGFRAVARELLDGAAFRVVGEAADGTSCLEQVRVLRPEVVLLDVQLPDASGFQVCRAIVEADATAGAGVVLCSVREAADYGPAVRRCGARAFVSKAGLSAEALLQIFDD